MKYKFKPMKPAFSYYGGKQRMAHKILPLLPPHSIYTEAFAGSCAVMFKKGVPELSNNNDYREAINDLNSDLYSLYKCLIENNNEFIELLNRLPNCSQKFYGDAIEYLKKPYNEREHFKTGVYVYYIIKNSVGSQIGRTIGDFNYSKIGRNNPYVVENSKKLLDKIIARLNKTWLFNMDAIDFMKKFDAPYTCHYIDPPYVGANQGHYSGYTQDDFRKLIEFCETCEGSVVLSHYDNDLITDGLFDIYEINVVASAGLNIKDKKRTEIVAVIDRSKNVKPGKKLWSPKTGWMIAGDNDDRQIELDV